MNLSIEKVLDETATWPDAIVVSVLTICIAVVLVAFIKKVM